MQRVAAEPLQAVADPVAAELGKITIKTHGGFEITIDDGPTPKIVLKTSGTIARRRQRAESAGYRIPRGAG